MTVQELAAEMHKFGLITHNRWAIDGAAMLRQQAEQIEALKADAERFVCMAEYLISDSTDHDYSILSAGTLNEMREVIDAIKGKS